MLTNRKTIVALGLVAPLSACSTCKSSSDADGGGAAVAEAQPQGSSETEQIPFFAARIQTCSRREPLEWYARSHKPFTPPARWRDSWEVDWCNDGAHAEFVGVCETGRYRVVWALRTWGAGSGMAGAQPFVYDKSSGGLIAISVEQFGERICAGDLLDFPAEPCVPEHLLACDTHRRYSVRDMRDSGAMR